MYHLRVNLIPVNYGQFSSEGLEYRVKSFNSVYQFSHLQRAFTWASVNIITMVEVFKRENKVQDTQLKWD